jgi:hypothetical protein
MAEVTIKGSPEEIARLLRRLGRQALIEEDQSVEQPGGQMDDRVNDDEEDKPMPYRILCNGT